jgi:DnaJ family protein C protein 9
MSENGGDISTEEIADPGSPNTSINPYRVLEIAKDATADQIKSAYRKLALKHHPGMIAASTTVAMQSLTVLTDKVREDEKAAATVKFQEIALAYAVLSDPKRRTLYDNTGRLSTSIEDEDAGEFDWATYYKEQFADVISVESIAAFKAKYQGSEEEKLDLIEAYVSFEGDMEKVMESVMCCEVLEDEDRFRTLIDSEIDEKRVPGYDAYTAETPAQRKRRIDTAKKEEKMAMAMAAELGVENELFGNGDSAKKSGGKKGKKSDGTEGLMALIQSRQKQRSNDFFADLEAKYAPKKGKRARAAEEEPPEEAFERTAQRAKKRAKGTRGAKGLKAQAQAEKDDAEEEEEEPTVGASPRKKRVRRS